jgi:predicted PurR-regulated permease PerM
MASATVTARPRPPRRIGPPTPRVALVIAAAVVLGIVLYLGRQALTPFIVGALLIYILDPAVRFLARRHFGRITIPRGLAVLIVYLVAFFVVVEGVVLLLVPLVSQMADFVGDLPRFFGALESALARLSEIYATLDLPPAVRDYIDATLADAARGAPQLDLGDLLPVARTIAGTLAGLFGFLIIPIWAFYILRDRTRLTARAYDALPPAWRDDTWAVLRIIDRVIGRWIRAQILLGLIVGGATYLGLFLLGHFVDPRFLQFAILLAVIAGVLELLPIIGPILAMIPTLLIALTTADPVVALLAVVVLYIVVQQVENAVLVPKIQGDAVELHPSVIIFALIVGGAIAGLAGAILSIPITAAARNVFRYLFRRLSEDDGTGSLSDIPGAEPTGDRQSEAQSLPAQAPAATNSEGTPKATAAARGDESPGESHAVAADRPAKVERPSEAGAE